MFGTTQVIALCIAFLLMGIWSGWELQGWNVRKQLDELNDGVTDAIAETYERGYQDGLTDAREEYLKADLIDALYEENDSDDENNIIDCGSYD